MTLALPCLLLLVNPSLSCVRQLSSAIFSILKANDFEHGRFYSLPLVLFARFFKKLDIVFTYLILPVKPGNNPNSGNIT